MKFSVAGTCAIAVVLGVALGQSERRAKATEAVRPSPASRIAPPASRPAPIEPEPVRVEERRAADTEDPPERETETAEPAAGSTLTPMVGREARRYLAQAYRELYDEEPAAGTLAILCAHWAHETDRGRRMHAYNFGGIKGTGPGGGSVAIWTREELGGSRLVRRTFRAYDSALEGARDYVNLLAQRYSAALRAAREQSVERFVSALGTRGYFTDDELTYLRSVARLRRDCAQEMRREREAPPGPRS